MEGAWGLSWAKFEETAQKTDAMLGWPPSRNPLSPTTGRLCREDMAIYGEDPALDSLSLVVCVQCGRVVKSQALVKHNEQYHSKQMSLGRASLPPYVPPVRGAHSVGLSSSAASTSPSVEGLRGDAFTASNLPTTLPGVTTTKTKEFDPNRHCGVWIEEERRQCTHSLSCKFHSLEARQSVRGRSKPFDVLLNEKKNKKLQKNKLKRTESQLSTGQPVTTHSPDLPLSEAPPAESMVIEEHIPIDMDSFPKPLAVSMLRSRSTLKGGVLFGRRSDNLRGGLVALSGKGRDYHHTTVHRKHSYNSLLREKAPQKYYHHRQRRLNDKPRPSPIKLPVPGHPQPPPHTPSHPLSSPLTASSVIANISSLINLPSSESVPSSPEESTTVTIDRTRTTALPDTIDLNQPINNGVLYETGSSGFLNHGAQDLTPGSEAPVTVPSVVEKPTEVASSKSKKKSRGKKRRKHKHSRPNQNSEEPQGNSDVHEAAPRVNGVTEMESSDGVGPVRVKQEPVSDHEEERVPVSKSPAVGLNGMVPHNTGSPAHHTFNPVNSAQSFVINPSHQLPSNYPLVTNLSPHMRGLVQMPGMSQNPGLFQSQQRFQLPTSSAPNASPLGLQLLPETIQRQFLQQQLLLANNPALLQQHTLQQQTNSFSPNNHPGFINLTAMSRTSGQQKSPVMPQLHHSPVSTGAASPHVAQPIFQLTNRQGGAMVRAPLAHIPAAQRNLPQLSSLGQAHNLPPFNQSLYHHSTPPASSSQRFPPQVT